MSSYQIPLHKVNGLNGQGDYDRAPTRLIPRDEPYEDYHNPRLLDASNQSITFFLSDLRRSASGTVIMSSNSGDFLGQSSIKMFTES